MITSTSFAITIISDYIYICEPLIIEATSTIKFHPSLGDTVVSFARRWKSGVKSKKKSDASSRTEAEEREDLRKSRCHVSTITVRDAAITRKRFNDSSPLFTIQHRGKIFWFDIFVSKKKKKKSVSKNSIFSTELAIAPVWYSLRRVTFLHRQLCKFNPVLSKTVTRYAKVSSCVRLSLPRY